VLGGCCCWLGLVGHVVLFTSRLVRGESCTLGVGWWELPLYSLLRFDEKNVLVCPYRAVRLLSEKQVKKIAFRK